MSYIIYKYHLEIITEQTITITEDYHILDIQIQNDRVCVWILIDTEQPKDNRLTILICGTGQEISKELYNTIEHIGTIQEGAMVWHLFVGVT